jgi:hypothetical protein
LHLLLLLLKQLLQEARRRRRLWGQRWPLFIVGVASGVPSGVEVLCGRDSVKFCCKKRFQVKLMFF